MPANGQLQEEKITADLKEYLGPVGIDCYEVKSIGPEVSGKFRYVKSTSYEEFQ